jgi:Chaperone of endosialidase
MKKSYISLIILFFFCCFVSAFSLQAQTPVLTVQGILKKSDGSAVPDETHTVKFALMDAEVNGNVVWSETLNDVETVGGVYSVILGTHSTPLNIPFNKDYYLSVKIGNSSQELLPRPRLTPAPYALSTLSTSSLNGAANKIPSGGIAELYQIDCNGNLNVDEETDLRKVVRVYAGILSTVGPINAGNGPFYGYGFRDDGNTGYGSNAYGVASIWAGGQNVINATSAEITMSKYLHITGTKQLSTTTVSYLHADATNIPSFPGGYNKPFSLEADDYLKADGMYVISDRRVKKDFAVSNGASDLSLLQGIRVTDYKYKDVVGKGNSWKKGVIAQEVKALIPDAVSLNTDLVPDIYALAQNAQLEASTLRLTMEKPHDLKIGDKVRIMAGDHQEDLPVTAVASATEFSLGNWAHAAPEKVFVYGREVNDFHAVDYDHLFTLNISATQELARRVELLEKENARFKSENADLRQLLEGIKADLQVIKGMQR